MLGQVEEETARERLAEGAGQQMAQAGQVGGPGAHRHFSWRGKLRALALAHGDGAEVS